MLMQKMYILGLFLSFFILKWTRGQPKQWCYPLLSICLPLKLWKLWPNGKKTQNYFAFGYFFVYRKFAFSVAKKDNFFDDILFMMMVLILPQLMPFTDGHKKKNVSNRTHSWLSMNLFRPYFCFRLNNSFD